MVVKNVMNMNPGDGVTSYANNSALQKAVISKALPFVDETLKAMFSRADGFPRCLKMVDLGCSSGPNTLFVISHILDTIEDLCRKKNHSNLPEFQVFLNDLPDNDFNNLFKLITRCSGRVIGKNEKRRCFLYGLPGSFYGRLFPSKTLHFAYASYSLHWLSQIPEGLGSNNKENIYMARTSPPEVFKAYAKQFQTDFSTFLSLRAQEMIAGGRMVLTLVGRSVEDPSSKDHSAHYTLLSQTLLDMVAQGVVKMSDLYSFNVPIYMPCEQEVKTVIKNEGSFNLEKVNVFWVGWDAQDNIVDDENNLVFDEQRSGKLAAECIRAFMEPMLVAHFGMSITVIDELFQRYAEKVGEYMSEEKSSYFSILISLRRK
ncbi:Benzoate carboxyl methyltransferase [Sesamum alatum]|uniref:Benzoate carboxyl methyltransferase n=1 Tax=Sesamum alatum TaxID=300844 RepID=A0AAE1XR62_9LAMI|nr:Benzoate carboxyl methyltransferase [Sesamum alatum]